MNMKDFIKNTSHDLCKDNNLAKDIAKSMVKSLAISILRAYALKT